MDSQQNSAAKEESYIRLPLLPAYCRSMGLVIMILAFLPALYVKILHPAMTFSQTDQLKFISLNVFMFGMCLVAVAREKSETQLKMALRIKSLAISLIIIFTFILLKPIADIFFNDSFDSPDGQGLLILLLFVYFFFYIVQKRGLEGSGKFSS